MKITALHILVCLSVLGGNLYAQNANFEWVKTYGNSSNQVGERAQAMVLDEAGNSYSIGAFNGAVDFDPGAGEFVLDTGSSSIRNVFVQKLDANGEFVWAVAHEIGVGGSNSDIKLDNNGNIYVVGTFKGIIDINPDTDIHEVGSLEHPNNIHTYIQRLDANGHFLQGYALISSSEDGGIYVDHESLLIDSANRVHLVGEFAGTVDFDLGSGVVEETSGVATNGTLVRNGFDVIMNDSGEFVEVQTIISNMANSIQRKEMDSNGYYIYAGEYTGSPDVNFGNDEFLLSENPNSNSDIFFMKYDSTGNFLWAKTFVSEASNGAVILSKLLINSEDKLIFTGSFNYVDGYLDVDPDSGEYPLNSNGSYDCFVVQLNTDGSLHWAASFGSDSQERLENASLDSQDAIYSVGYFTETMDFDPSEGIDVISVNEDTGGTAFIHRLSSNGIYSGTSILLSIPGNPTYTSTATAYQVQIDNQGDLLVYGLFQVTVDFDPGAETYIVESAGGEDDVFLLKLSPIVLGLNETPDFTNARIYPSPTTHDATLHLGLMSKDVEVQISDITGKSIAQFSSHFKEAIAIPLPTTAGVYLVQITSNDEKKTFKIIKE